MDNNLRKFFSNFQKHGTISKTTYNVKKHKTIIKNNKVKDTVALETRANILVTNEEVLQQHTKSTTESIKECYGIKLSSFNSQQTMNIDTNENVSADETKTHACLKEFEEIQEDVNRELLKECGSFNEIEDSLNNVSDVDLRQPENLRCLQFEIPRFDLLDLIQGFGDENYNFGPNDFNIAGAPNLEDNNSKSIEETVNIIDINSNANEADVISISSEDSQTHLTNLLPEKNNMYEFSTHESKNNGPKKVNYEINEDPNKDANNIHKPTKYSVNFGFTNIQDEDVILISSADRQAHITNVITEESTESHEPRNAEPSNVNFKNVINDVPHEEANNIAITIQDADIISISSEDSQAHIINVIPEEYTETHKPGNVEPNNVNNDKAEPILKNVVFIDNSDEDKDGKRGEPKNMDNKNKDGNYKPKNVQETSTRALDLNVIIDSEDDCGYQSSDFEFITEDEAKLDGLIIKFNPDNNVNIKSSKLKRVKTIEVAPDMFSGQISIPSLRICAGQSNVQDSFGSNVPGYSLLGNTIGPYNQDSELKKSSNNTMHQQCSKININPGNPSSEQVQNVLILRNHEYNPENDTLSEPSCVKPEITIQTKAEPNNLLELNYAGSVIQNIGLVGNNSDPGMTSSQSQLQRDYPGYSENGPGPSYFQKNGIEASQIQEEDYSGFNYDGPGPSHLQRNGPEPYQLQELHPAVNNDGPGPSIFGRNCTEQEDYRGFNNDAPGSSYLQSNCPESSQLQELYPKVNNDGPGPNYFRRNCTEQEYYPVFKNDGPGPSYLQINCPERSQLQELYPGVNNDGPGSSYFIRNCPEPSQLQEGYPGFNNDGPGPSYIQRNGSEINNFGSYISQDNVGLLGSTLSCDTRRDAEMPDPRIERWRAFRHRNENQFILDYSYRENHRLLNADEYYRLFDPNNGPLPNQYMQPMENKSTMSTSVMLVQYNGVGFDMQMLQDSDDDDDDEVKEEANKSAQMILQMYPSENRKRRRRRS